MQPGLTGKICWVSGGASGIGEASVRAFADSGAKVVVADMDPGRGEVIVRELTDGGAEAMFTLTNVLDTDSVNASIQSAVDAFGGLDVVVNSAGKTSNGRDDDFERNLDMFLLGVWRGVNAAIPHLQARGGGSIVNIASIAGVTGSIGPLGYGPAKHGVVGLTKTVALRYAKEGIRSNVVCPGYIRTGMTADFTSNADEDDELINNRLRVPMGRWGHASEIAAAVAFFASDQASFVTGGVLVADGGLTAR